MEEDRTPALATEEKWILKYRAALDADLAEQSHAITIHKLLRRTLDRIVPASEWILERHVRPHLLKALATIRREMLHLY
jgi:hypothetical protein